MSSEVSRIGVRVPLIGAEFIKARNNGIFSAEAEIIQRYRCVCDERFKIGFVHALQKFIQDVDDVGHFHTRAFTLENGFGFLKVSTDAPEEWVQGYIEATAFLLFLVNADYDKTIEQVKMFVYGTLRSLVVTKAK